MRMKELKVAKCEIDFMVNNENDFLYFGFLPSRLTLFSFHQPTANSQLADWILKKVAKKFNPFS